MMKINKQILNVLKQTDLKEKNIVPILITYYLDYELPDYFPKDLSNTLNKTGIFNINKKGEVEWKISLFEGQEVEWGWVLTEFQALFKPFKTHKKNKAICVTRMKQLFKKNPSYTREKVIEATRTYIQERLRLNKYAMEPQNFILTGRPKESVLAGRIDDLNNKVEDQIKRGKHVVSKMQ